MISIILSLLYLCLLVSGLLYLFTLPPKTVSEHKGFQIRTVDTIHCQEADPEAYAFTDEEPTTLLLVHLGAAIPYHIYDHIEQVRLMSPMTRIIVALNDSRVKQYVKHIEGVEVYHYNKNYQVSATDGGIFHTSLERFLVLEDMMKQLSLDTVFHMEHDNMLYIPLSYLKKQCDALIPKKVGIPRDSADRCIPSLLYIGSLEALTHYNCFIRDQNFKEIDMASWCQFMKQHPESAETLSVIPNTDSYLHLKGFKGLVDAAAMGQYVGGIDTIHSFKSTKGFLSETAEYSAEEYKPVWSTDQHQRRVPLICYQNKYYRLYNLHIHCKRLHEFISAPRIRQADIIQGEKFQNLADIQFIDEDSIPTQEWRDEFIAYTHTHLLPLFFEHQYPKREKPFILITHNSDYPVDKTHLEYLNQGKIIKWYAQNVQVRHPRLQPLPIGQANSKYDHGKSELLEKAASKWYTKTGQLYVNFTDTHTYREEARRKALQQEHTYRPEGEKDYVTYLEQVAQHHQIACPYGNGADTHRFWEALYMGSEPVLYESENTEWTNPNPHYMYGPTPLGRRWWRFSFYQAMIEQDRENVDTFDLVLFANSSIFKETLDQCAYRARQHLKGLNKIWYMGDKSFQTFYGEKIELPNHWPLVNDNIMIQPPTILWHRTFYPFHQGKAQWFKHAIKLPDVQIPSDTEFMRNLVIPCRKEHMLQAMDQLSKMNVPESPQVIYDGLSMLLQKQFSDTFETLPTLKERKAHVHQKYRSDFLDKTRQCDYIVLQ